MNKKINLYIKNAFINLVIILISTIVTLLLIELCTRWIYKSEIRNYADLFESYPDTYSNSDFFDDAFIEALKAKQNIKWNLVPETRIIYPSDYDGDFISIKNNLRVTFHQPDSFSNKIHVFGGSTVFNGFVPDAYTICSYLQNKINIQFPNKYRVINHGVPSINTAQQLEILQTLKLNPDDIVVFYGGVNDGLLFSSGRINGWIMGEPLMNYDLKNLNIVQRLRFKIYRHLHKRSDFIEKFLNPYAYQVPDRLQKTEKVEAMKNQLSAHYKKSITSADSICKTNNVKFFNFVQPNLLTKSKKSPYEEKILNNKKVNPKLWLLSIEKAYEVLPKLSDELNLKGIFSKDISNVFDNKSDSYFVDYCHMSDKGNIVIASHIFNYISPEL